MTEADWLVSTDPCVMLRFLGDRASARKLRLLLCAQVLTESHLLADERSRRAVRTAEAAADGRAGAAALAQATAAARTAWEAVDPRFPRRYGRLARTPAGSPATGSAARLVRYAADPALDAAQAERAAWGLTPARRCVLAALVRDLFGNPFRPVAADPGWRSADVVGPGPGDRRRPGLRAAPPPVRRPDGHRLRRAPGDRPLPRRRAARPRLLGRGPGPGPWLGVAEIWRLRRRGPPTAPAPASKMGLARGAPCPVSTADTSPTPRPGGCVNTCWPPRTPTTTSGSPAAAGPSTWPASRAPGRAGGHPPVRLPGLFRQGVGRLVLDRHRRRARSPGAADRPGLPPPDRCRPRPLARRGPRRPAGPGVRSRPLGRPDAGRPARPAGPGPRDGHTPLFRLPADAIAPDE